MSESTDVSDPLAETSPPARAPSGVPGLIGRIPRLGVLAWSFVGAVVTAIIVFFALAAVSEIMLPLTFAAVLAVCFKPMVDALVRKGWKPTLASGLLVLALLALMVFIVVATVKGVTEQLSEIGDSTSAALENAAEHTDEIDVEQAELDAARESVEAMAPAVTTGFLSGLVEGFGVLVELAGGLILGSLIMYYMLKDGTRLRRSVVAQVDETYRGEVDGFVGDACQILRSYGQGRTIMSAIVSAVVGLGALLLGLPLVFTIVVVNFVGGYIPYIGAFLGGGLAVIIALGEGGIGTAAIMLLIVLVSNLALENFVEPRVMGRTLDIHPLVVLVATALGGLLGGIVGLILAVPAYVIAGNAITRLRSRGVVQMVADKAQPAVKQILG